LILHLREAITYKKVESMSSAQKSLLKEKAASFPDSPGVYFMKNAKGRVLYVGKAKDLSARIRSYLQSPGALDAKTASLMRAAETVEYIATDTEVEALVLECTLIKEHRPRYNIRLKDDKRYPYLKLTRQEPFPRLYLVRRIENDGAEYFGPFTDANAVRRTLRTIRTIFPLRDCRERRPGRIAGRECLNFHIGRCRAPCTGRIDESGYREIVDEVRLFLRGKSRRLGESIRERMWRLSRMKRYEEAAAARDQAAAYEKISERQRAATPLGTDEDFVAVAREGDRSCGAVLKVRDGAIHGRESFFVPAPAAEPDRDVFEAFFELYYHGATDVPPCIYAQASFADERLVERWLSAKRGARVRIAIPRRGEKRALLRLALKNAALQLASETRSPAGGVPALVELREALGLPSTPTSIEAFDISNIQGTDAVGSLAAFERGAPRRSRYRRYRIRDVHGSDDFAMMREVLSRRLARLKDGAERPPDLIVIDGGKGQLAAARRAMEDLGVPPIPIIGLAKRNEEIFTGGAGDPLVLPRSSAALRLLQRVRDEAHRFAVEYHRKLRGRGIRRSELDEIPGVGAKRKTALLANFGSMRAIKQASAAELARVPGIGMKTAERIHELIHRT
jgi:excinuclease ABC subunit C